MTNIPRRVYGPTMSITDDRCSPLTCGARDGEGEKIKIVRERETRGEGERRMGKTRAVALYGILNKRPYRPAVKLGTEATRRSRGYMSMMHV